LRRRRNRGHIDDRYQDIQTGVIILAAVTLDQLRQRRHHD